MGIYWNPLKTTTIKSLLASNTFFKNPKSSSQEEIRKVGGRLECFLSPPKTLHQVDVTWKICREK